MTILQDLISTDDHQHDDKPVHNNPQRDKTHLRFASSQNHGRRTPSRQMNGGARGPPEALFKLTWPLPDETKTQSINHEHGLPASSIFNSSVGTSRWRHVGRLGRLGPAKRAARLSPEAEGEKPETIELQDAAKEDEDAALASVTDEHSLSLRHPSPLKNKIQDSPPLQLALQTVQTGIQNLNNSDPDEPTQEHDDNLNEGLELTITPAFKNDHESLLIEHANTRKYLPDTKIKIPFSPLKHSSTLGQASINPSVSRSTAAPLTTSIIDIPYTFKTGLTPLSHHSAVVTNFGDTQDKKVSSVQYTPNSIFRASSASTITAFGANQPHPSDSGFSAPPPKPTLDYKIEKVKNDVHSDFGRGKATITVNNQPYARLETVGRGGSSKVYKVIAPATNKIYALKKVNLDKADWNTIVGYKNEIALLQKLSKGESERVIKLYDAEICDEKGYILMLLEFGDIDFAHILQQHTTTPFSLNFIRYYWEQMLHCVATIHEEKIVHSDLKPANFLLVSGRLKLIDFGIAKAIGNDTTNISRDQQVGTVNYMSPEAIVDTNTVHSMTGGNARLMKLGRPSDIWSLGCILYQMVYGKPPFAHLSMVQKIQIIPNAEHSIAYPNTGVGGIRASRSIRRCLIGCLQRNAKARMTIDELLTDDLLTDSTDLRRVQLTLEEMTHLMQRTLEYGKANGPSINPEIVSSLAKNIFEKLGGEG